MVYIEVESEEDLSALLSSNKILRTYAFQNLDFYKVLKYIQNHKFEDCIFMGCGLPKRIINENLSDDCLIFPQINVPYNAFPNKLYSPKTLFTGYRLGKPDSYENTPDKIIYNHYMKTGKEADDIKESLARRLHDHSITDALYDYLAQFDERKIVAIMGGHSLPRGHKNYMKLAKISKKLTEMGYLMVSGGGPGAMEATHLGAWLSGKSDEDLQIAIDILAEAPVYNSPLWVDKAFKVLERYPISKYESLGIPTWLYGHEPPTVFATHIAKYFANSVREDGLLAIAKGGIIFSPGSAGTIQEIFQEATQNHYLVYGFASPMIFFDTTFWTEDRPVYKFISQLAAEGKYKNMILSAYDSINDVVSEVQKFTEVLV